MKPCVWCGRTVLSQLSDGCWVGAEEGIRRWSTGGDIYTGHSERQVSKDRTQSEPERRGYRKRVSNPVPGESAILSTTRGRSTSQRKPTRRGQSRFRIRWTRLYARPRFFLAGYDPGHGLTCVSPTSLAMNQDCLYSATLFHCHCHPCCFS